MRAIIWTIVFLLFGYAVFQVVRAIRIRPPQAEDEAAKPFGGEKFLPDEGDPPAGRSGALDDDGEELYSFPLRPGTERGGAKGDSGAPAREDFGLALEVRQLHHEVEQLRTQLREESSSHRARVESLEERVNGLKEQLDAALAGQGVSPEYNEALVFARRGLDVDAIAERCGISVAEAELVRSLARPGGERTKENE